MIKLSLARKFTAVLANLSLLLNTFLPFALVIQPVYAQDPQIIVSTIQYDSSAHKLDITTDTSQKIAYQLFYKTDEKIDAIAGNDLNQANQSESFYLGTCSSNSVCLSQNISRGILKIESNSKFYSKLFTLENNVLTITKEIESLQSDLTPEEDDFLNNIDTQVLGSTVSNWTFEKVELNKTYTAPQNDQVKITFTKLPEISGNIKIEEITLTEDQIKQTGSVSNKAYDITSDMVDGTFAYNLSLPIPETLKNQTVEIKFAEEMSEIDSAQTVSNNSFKNENNILINGLDHFTIFIITDPTQNLDKIYINEFVYNPSSGSEWIELYNGGSTTVNLSTWRLVDLSGNKLDLSGNINPYSFRVFNINWLNNTSNNLDGDTISLQKKGLLIYRLVDSLVYYRCNKSWCSSENPISSDDVLFGKSIGRIVDGGPNWTSFSKPTQNFTNVPDEEPPVITLNGPSLLSLNLNDIYIEQGATVTDNRDTGLIAIITGLVDTSKTGAYTVFYDATDSIGNHAQVIRTVNVVDTISPVIEINNTVPKSTYKLGEAINVHVIDINLDRVEIDRIDSAAPANDKHWVYTGSWFGLWWLNDGTYRISAYDMAENVTIHEFTTDETKPSVIGSTETKINPASLTITATDIGSGVSRITGNIYKYDPTNVKADTEGYTLFKSNSSTIANPFIVDLSLLVDGKYYVRYNASDVVGNISNTERFDFTIDSNPPSIPRLLGSEIFITKGTAFSQKWEPVSDAVLYQYESCHMDPGDHNAVCSNVKYSKTYTGFTKNVDTGQPNSHFWWRVKAKDVAGNWSNWSESKEVIIDNSVPASTISLPENSGPGSIITTKTWNGLVSGTAMDIYLSGIKEVKLSIKNDNTNLYWNGSAWQSDLTLITANGKENWNYQLLDDSLTDGSYTIKSHAIDNAGNQENTYTLTIVLDNTISEVGISLDPTNPDASNGWYKTQPEVTLTHTDANFDKIQYQWDSQSDSGWNTYLDPFKLAIEGSHILYYRAVDKATNISPVGVKNIKWDKTDLEFGPQNISANPNPTSGSTSKISWEKAKDNDGIDHYEVQWNLNDSTNPLSYSKTVDGNTFETEIDKLIEGRWTVKVIAFDASGKSKDNSIDLIVDRTGPSAPVLTLTGTGTGTASLSWNTIPDAKDYIIWYGNTPGTYLYGARVGNITSYTVQGLGAGNYYFVVKAVDAAQNQSSNSNEVNTGTIAGAIGIEPNQPAQGFAPEVLGTDDTKENNPEINPVPSGEVLGTSLDDDGFNWWWLLLLIIPVSIIGYKFAKRKE